MFYPENALRRGGKFYICWLADSWPGHFKKLTNRQLWSQDVRVICEDLMEVVTKESGFPDARFSLRLSSQLMRGLVRLYQAKVASFLGTLCMLNANVIRGTNQKWNRQESRLTNGARNQQVVVHRPKRARITEVVEDIDRVEEQIQNSGNAVTNIEEITLRDTVIPEVQVPLDGFGEENPEQALALLYDRTLEHMLAADGSAAQRSGLELLALSEDRSRDRSRLQLPAPQMERISGHDASRARESIAADLTLALEDVDKDIPILPIPPPDLTITSPEQEQQEQQMMEPDIVPEVAKDPEVPTELDKLDEIEPVVAGRRVRKLIIDKKIKISDNNFRLRLNNIAIELRSENSLADVIDLTRLPWALYQRPARAGPRPRSNLSDRLTALYQRNLGVRGRVPRDPCLEEMLLNSGMRNLRPRPALAQIEQERILECAQRNHLLAPIPEQPFEKENLDPQRPSIEVQLEVADLPTEISPKKRSAAELADFASPTAKKSRHWGFVSFKQSQKFAEDAQAQPNEKEPVCSTLEDLIPEQDTRKTLPADYEILVPTDENQISQMLQAAGLADALAEQPARKASQKTRLPSEDSGETPLGSLDRTAVDLGESVRSTDTQKYLRKEWGTEGTMRRVADLIRSQVGPLTVAGLVARAGSPGAPRAAAGSPEGRCPRAAVAARCFTSLLKLKQHGFLQLEKDPVSLSITNITYGPRLRK